MQDEKQFTPHAELGWLSWDQWSPEQDFCRFVGMLQRMLQPAQVLETGVGIGRVTSHLDLSASAYIGFESNPEWRQPPAELGQASPSPEQISIAQLIILDSEPTHRIAEIKLWADVGARGSVCVVHDAGNGHGEGTVHHQIGAACAATGQPGIFLRNPRGGWMGVHT